MNPLRTTRTAFSFAALAVALLGTAGCTPKAADFKPSKLFSLDSAWPWGGDEEPEQGIPVRIVGTWTDTVLHTPGQKPQRGFGGRLVFYRNDDEKPILVDGQLVVYAFDENGREPTDNRPTRRYVFPPDQMPLHMSKSEIGASYSFWLPWDEAGGPQTDVSLIARFEPKGGPVVVGEQTRHMLPGSLTPGAALASKNGTTLPEGVPSRPAWPTLESLRANAAANGSTELASYESAASGNAQAASTAGIANASGDTPARQMTTTSITLPDSFRLRNEAATVRAAAPTPATPLPTPQFPQQQPPPPAPHGQPAASITLPTQSVAAVQPSAWGALPARLSSAPALATRTIPSTMTGGLPTSALAPQQPLAPQAMVAPFAQPQSSATQVGSAAPVGSATAVQQQLPTMPQQEVPAATGVTTTVSYPSREEMLRLQQVQPSFGSAQTLPPALVR